MGVSRLIHHYFQLDDAAGFVQMIVMAGDGQPTMLVLFTLVSCQYKRILMKMFVVKRNVDGNN